MGFEFNPEKSDANEQKHGIDFVKAQMLWEDPDRLQVQARTQGEPRWMLISQLDGKVWSVIFTIRDEKIRIISVRRSRAKEVEQYEK